VQISAFADTEVKLNRQPFSLFDILSHRKKAGTEKSGVTNASHPSNCFPSSIHPYRKVVVGYHDGGNDKCRVGNFITAGHESYIASEKAAYEQQPFHTRTAGECGQKDRDEIIA
jgi:hypothetical protein